MHLCARHGAMPNLGWRVERTAWRSQFSQYMDYLLHQLCSRRGDRSFTVDPAGGNFPFRQKDTPLPSGQHLCVYFLVSVSRPMISYVGHTSNIRRRLDQHNSVTGGSHWTRRSHLKPWGLLAYVVGFQDKAESARFEKRWQDLIAYEQQQARGKLTSMERMKLGERICKIFDEENINNRLCMVVCGGMTATL